MMNLNTITNEIKQWAIDRGLDQADPSKQMLKVMEEIGEIAEALAKGDEKALQDGIGDGYVTLVILALILNYDIEGCILMAYNEIKDRKGKMVNGVFVKESDLK